jgi:tetratricopeptide (TPR) repeat protein
VGFLIIVESEEGVGTMKSKQVERTAEQMQKGAFLLKLADNKIREGDYAGAREAVDKAREVDPSNPYVDAYEGRMNHLMKAMQKEKAMVEQQIVTHVESAEKLIESGDIDEALQHLTDGFLLDPMHAALLHFEEAYLPSIAEYQKNHPLHQKSLEEKNELLGRYMKTAAENRPANSKATLTAAA